jgi:DpnII restriction endonuclease
MTKTIEEKFRTVIEKNTFYFFNTEFAETYEGYLITLKESPLLLKNDIETKGLRKEIFVKFLAEKENGLDALLALTGFSNESLKRLITLIRVADNESLSKLTLKEKWCPKEKLESVKEWSSNTVIKLLRNNECFRKGMVNLFFEGGTLPFLAERMPLFELKKLSLEKLKFEPASMIDTLIRYKVKGSMSGKKQNNPETLIAGLLARLEVPFQTGDLAELIANAFDTKRTMDFVIPNKQNPKIIVESSFLVTTSSGQGDKSKTEIAINSLLKKHYKGAIFVGFIDGLGWYARQNDLKRMVAAYEDVFTFHEDELDRFEKLVVEKVKNVK